MTDGSDHLPVFAVLEVNDKLKVRTNAQTDLVGAESPKAIMALKEELLNHDWQEVYVDDINESYDAFLFYIVRFLQRLLPHELN